MVAAVTLSTDQLVAASAAQQRLDTVARMGRRGLEDALETVVALRKSAAALESDIRERLATMRAEEGR